MASNYPSSIDNFTDPSGTSLITSPDHAGLHTDVNDAINNMQTTLGTTSATAALKNITAGKFAVAGSADTFQKGTIVTSAFNNGTIGTASIIGGTLSGAVANSATLGTPTVTGALQIAGTISQTGAANHLTLTPGDSKLVRTTILRQDGTTNTYTNNQVMLTGWGYITGDSTNTMLTKTVTFGVNFASAPIVHVTPLTYLGGSVIPSAISDFVSNHTAGDMPLFSARSIGTSSTVISLSRADSGTLVNSVSWGFSWLAVGVVS